MKYLFSLIIALAAFNISVAQDNLIEGVIYDSVTEEPVTFAKVTLLENDAYVLVDYKGQYFFKDVAPGQYTLEVSFLGYQTARHIIKIEEGVQYEANIHLKQMFIHPTIADAQLSASVE